MTHDRRMPTGGTLASLAAAAGLLVGLRTIASYELPRPAILLGIEPMAREGLGVLWSHRASWPAEFQAVALERLVGLLAALVLATIAVATLNAVILLAENAADRRQELAIRSAMGASPWRLVRMLLGELRTLALAGASLGLVLGLTLGGALRAAWPGVLLRDALTPDAVISVAVALAVLAGVAGLAHIGIGIKLGRGPEAAASLRAGSRMTADPGAVFFRRAVPAVHTAVAGTALVGAVALSAAIEAPRAAELDQKQVMVIGGTAPSAGAWSALLESVAALPDLASESISSTGALLGLGVRDHVTTQCGMCVRGGMLVPMWGAVADHHSVGPGYFALADIELLQGRAFDASDALGAEPVAIVSETFARSSFEAGRPLGKKIKLGRTLDDWYTVVGVVADLRVPVLGADDLPREALYLSALQRPARTGHLLVRGELEAIDAAHGRMVLAGFSPSEPRTLAQFRADETVVLRWVRTVAVLLSGLVLLFAVHGVHVTALQVTRRRWRELAIRRAVGAGSGRIVAHVLGERVRVGLWGVAGMVFWGTMLVAFLRKAAGMESVGPTPYFVIAGVLIAVAVASSTAAAREALGVEPGAVMD
ncbi:MAG: ABC transporter permease [Gemmatimonadetes bacterium]|nr:ABC transporter permease [Gemmatimonadota bacterium]